MQRFPKYAGEQVFRGAVSTFGLAFPPAEVHLSGAGKPSLVNIVLK